MSEKTLKQNEVLEDEKLQDAAGGRSFSLEDQNPNPGKPDFFSDNTFDQGMKPSKPSFFGNQEDGVEAKSFRPGFLSSKEDEDKQTKSKFF